jgi:uncharacterized LabA/DUF88 family protein
MPRPKNIALYVDYENVRQTLERRFKVTADPSKIGAVLRKTAQEQGTLVVQYVYGDWNFLHRSPNGGPRIDVKKALTVAGLKPVDVPVKGTGQDTKDRTDIFLAVDASFDIFKKKNIGTVMLASSDGDYCPLVRNIQGEDITVVVCGFTVSMSPELMAIANSTISLEKLLGLELPTTSGDTIEAEAALTYDWMAFIEALHKAEKQRWGFVGLKHFRDSWMNESMVADPTQRHYMVNQAIGEQIVVKHMVERPGQSFPTTAIRLNKLHPLVVKFLKGR